MNELLAGFIYFISVCLLVFGLYSYAKNGHAEDSIQETVNTIQIVLMDDSELLFCVDSDETKYFIEEIKKQLGSKLISIKNHHVPTKNLKYIEIWKGCNFV